jgi:hypothetical protein
VFFSDWRVLRRRWHVVLVGLLITVALCAAVTRVVHVNYQATGRTLLLPPSATTPAGDNPFLALGGLDVVTGVLAKTQEDKDAGEKIIRAAGGGEFEVIPDPLAGGPVLLVTARASDPRTALKVLDLVFQRLPQSLSELQTTSGVPVKALIRSKEITRDTQATKVFKPVVRALIAVAALGLAMTILGAALLDGLLLARTRRRRPDEEQPSEDSNAPPLWARLGQPSHRAPRLPADEPAQAPTAAARVAYAKSVEADGRT